MTEPTVLVVGAGSAGRRHAINLVDLGAIVTVADVADVEPPDGTDVKRLPPDGGLADTDLAPFDAVVVASPSAMHAGHVAAAVEGGAVVLVEKPLATTDTDLDALVARAGQRVTVGYNLRLHRPYQLVADAVRAGRLGTPILARVWFGSWLPDWRPGRDHRESYSATRALGGGALWDASHEIDLLVWLFGLDWDVIGARVARDVEVTVDADDTAHALLEADGGPTAAVELDLISRRYRRGIEIVGDEATVRFDWASGTVVVESGASVEIADVAAVDLEESYRAEAAHLLEFADGQAGPLVTAAEAAATVRICAAVERAGR